MSDDVTFDDVLATMRDLFQRVGRAIDEAFIQPLKRWFSAVWPRIIGTVKHLSYQATGKRRPRQRNSRIQKVQVKRARLMLPPSGKYVGMSRRASYALATARK